MAGLRAGGRPEGDPSGGWPVRPAGARHLRRDAGAVRDRRRARRPHRRVRRVARRRRPARRAGPAAHRLEHRRPPARAALFLAGVEDERFYFVHSYAVTRWPAPGRPGGRGCDAGPSTASRSCPRSRTARCRRPSSTRRSPATPAPTLLANWLACRCERAGAARRRPARAGAWPLWSPAGRSPSRGRAASAGGRGWRCGSAGWRTWAERSARRRARAVLAASSLWSVAASWSCGRRSPPRWDRRALARAERRRPRS